jgi:integral membrane sensor domain MASE1
MPAPDRSTLDNPIRTTLGVVIFYAIGSYLAWHEFGADVGLAFFPPAGVTVAALILTSRRHWPLLLTAAFLTEVTVDLSQQLGFRYSVGYGLANTVEPLIAVLVFDRLNPERVTLEQRRGKLSYMFGACGIGALAGALVGATVATQHRPGTRWTSNVAHWWAGDGLAILAIGASIVLVSTTQLSKRKRIELVIGALATAIASLIGMNSNLAPATIILPVLTVLAFRIGPAGATVGGSVFALVANYSTNAGNGYFANLDTTPTTRLALAQTFIAVLVIVSWSIGVEVLARVAAVGATVHLAQQRDEATAAVQAIHRAVGPHKIDTAGPFRIGSCYRQSNVTGLVGGDWFDAFELPDDRLMFVVGDVVGHGIDAMEDMAQLRLATRAFATEGHNPSHILAELSLFTINATRGRFATVVIGIYDPVSSQVTIASAGHPPPLIRRHDQQQSQYLPIRPGTPLGTTTHATYDATRVTLATGDTIAFYTDGVVERRSHPIDDGLEELATALNSVDLDAHPDQICEQLIDNCFPTIEAHDDRCLLMVQVIPVCQGDEVDPVSLADRWSHHTGGTPQGGPMPLAGDRHDQEAPPAHAGADHPQAQRGPPAPTPFPSTA